MSRARHRVLVAVALIVPVLSGCALSRKGVTGLSRAQGDYYARLGATLKENRQKLDSGLALQLSADRARQRHVLEWERDLQRAEVILQQRTSNVTGQQRLLELKLAELDLAAVDRVAALQATDEARKQTILKLYDKVREGVTALEKNNTTILSYLEAGDAKVLLRSLDTAAVFRVVEAVQQLRNELAQTDTQAQDKEQRRIDDAQKAVERARDLLIKVYGK